LSMGPKQPSISRSASSFSTASRSVPPQAERVCQRCGGVYPAYIKFCGRCGNNMS
jgi:rRNA maturation endonuclease Nob1